MIKLVRTVNFGTAKSGLATVGYTLYNPDLTEKKARTTTGVSEILSGTGIYRAEVEFDKGWSGIILWDTGEATKRYGSEQFNAAEIAQINRTRLPAINLPDPVWSVDEKDALLKSVRAIVNALSEMGLDRRFSELSRAIEDNVGSLSAVVRESSFDSEMVEGVGKKLDDLAVIMASDSRESKQTLEVALAQIKLHIAKEMETALNLKNEKLLKLSEQIGQVGKDLEQIWLLVSKLCPTDLLEEFVSHESIRI